MSLEEIEITIFPSIRDIGQKDWDACACPEAMNGGIAIDPFTTFRFLNALEQSASVGAGTGWQPQYIMARLQGKVIAVAPLYVKSHSQGEYIFDHNWAHAYEQAGGRYYPKLQIAVPHTPVTGRRFLCHPDFKQSGFTALAQGMQQLALENQISSIHATFCSQEEAEIGAKLGFMPRTTQQFHWHNQNYKNFDEFLIRLSSRKRKNIRKERLSAQNFGGEIHHLHGDQLTTEHWDAFWQFYQNTGARKWGRPYLTRDFFERAQSHLRDDIILVMAKNNGEWIAGALNFIGRDALYGRYWGCIEHHPCLHFELCYYQAIDIAIARGLKRVEAGAQGQHKLARGYLPCVTQSLHWVADAGFAHAIETYLTAERDAMNEEIEILTDYGPFKNNPTQDLQNEQD